MKLCSRKLNPVRCRSHPEIPRTSLTWLFRFSGSPLCFCSAVDNGYRVFCARGSNQVGRVDNSRPFYVRVRLSDPAHGSSQGSSSYSQPPCCQWSDLLIITVYEHAHRSSFNSRQPEVGFNNSYNNKRRPCLALVEGSGLEGVAGVSETLLDGGYHRYLCHARVAYCTRPAGRRGARESFGRSRHRAYIWTDVRCLYNSR